MMDDMDESYFDWSDEDDIICSSKYISSDEEDDNLATIIATNKQRTAGGSVFQNKKKEEEDDDFEKAMASELSQTMRHLTATFCMPGSSGASCAADETKKKEPQFYDDVYFDSDESDQEETAPDEASKEKRHSRHGKRKVLSNDELFYDPKMDERDQEWVNQKRRSYQPRERRPGRTLGVENNNTIQLPPSDAVLNCPACLTTLCMDCQRHEIYHNQYRAMFVFNCVVDVTERLSYPSKEQKKKDFIKNKKARKNRKRNVHLENKEETEDEPRITEVTAANPSIEDAPSVSQVTSESTNNSPSQSIRSTGNNACDLGKELFHPVMCKICNTKVAVYDADEVYHFFNVVTSY